jgi:hypothetical protein
VRARYKGFTRLAKILYSIFYIILDVSRTALTYLYLGIGWSLAVLSDISSRQRAEERADTDDDGEAEQSVATQKRIQDQHLSHDDSRARPPKQAAEYRAGEIFAKPLRTIGLLIGYVVVFLTIAVAISFTGLVRRVAGDTAGDVADIISAVLSPYVPAILLPLLPIIATVAGVVFALIIHQSFKTSGDIRRHWAQ